MTEDSSNKNDLMTFLDDESSAGNSTAVSAKHSSEILAHKASDVWKILITDDEEDVHSATAFALRNTKILGRTLQFLHATSSKEAKEVLQQETDIAVIILDVVMETPNAGLDLVAVIRDELEILDARIILRTGQPNQAPEIEVIRDYDINDYKLKSELTQGKLYAALTTAVRSYQQIRIIEAGKKSLDLIVRSSAELLTNKGLHAFAEGVILHLSGLLDIPPEGLICVRRVGKTRDIQPQIIAAAGHYCVLIDKPLSDLVEDEAKALLIQSLDNRCNVYHRTGIALYLGSDARGDMSCYVSSSNKIDDVDQHLLELFCSNITICADNLSLLDRLSNYAYYDMQVGLPNENALVEEIDRILDQSDLEPHSLAILDIHQFDSMSSMFGQKYGAKLLKAVGKRAATHFPVPCMVARISRDIFAILGPTSCLDQERLSPPFIEPFNIDGVEQVLRIVTVAVSLTDIEGDSADVMKAAGVALEHAKNQGSTDIVTYNRTMQNESQLRLCMLKELTEHFSARKLFLAYQPVLELASEKIVGFEALLRWKTEEGDFVAPDRFIPLAEKTGLMVPIGEWVFQTSLGVLKLLDERGMKDVHMSINLSCLQLGHPQLIPCLEKIAEESIVDTNRIILEVSELSIRGDEVSKVNTLLEIARLGFSITLDNFGSNTLPLKLLKQLPLKSIKLDKTFMQQANTQSGKQIVEMSVQLGKMLGAKVIAKGVEEEWQKTLLTELEFDKAQGFFFAEPMPVDELYLWLDK